jgi:hypothetical protein
MVLYRRKVPLSRVALRQSARPAAGVLFDYIADVDGLISFTDLRNSLESSTSISPSLVRTIPVPWYGGNRAECCGCWHVIDRGRQ